MALLIQRSRKVCEIGGSSKSYIYEANGRVLLNVGSQTISLTGFNFTDDTVFEIIGNNAVIDSFTILSPEEATLNITPSAVGIFELIAKNRDVASWNTPIQIEVENLTVIIPGTVQTPWVNQVRAITGLGAGTISKSTTSIGWNTQAQFLCAPANSDFELFVTYGGKYNTSNSSTSYAMFGVSTSLNTNSFYSSMKYCHYVRNSVDGLIYENGVNPSAGTGALSIGDVLSIKRTNGVFTYYKNGIQYYQSLQAPYFGECYFDCSLYQNIKLTNIRSEYS